jgi:adenylate cyclase class 2
MSEEIEAKVRIADPAAFRRRMAERSESGGETVFEDNRLFDDAAGTLRRRGAALRVREERPVVVGEPLRATLTYKGPRAESELKRREEIEIEVQAAPGSARASRRDAEATPGAPGLALIFEAMGLRETFRYQKRRSVWRVGECEIALDELPYLGWFVEVEGPTERSVRAQLEDLALADAELLSADYIHLLTERLKSLGLDPSRALFEA